MYTLYILGHPPRRYFRDYVYQYNDQKSEDRPHRPRKDREVAACILLGLNGRRAYPLEIYLQRRIMNMPLFPEGEVILI